MRIYPNMKKTIIMFLALSLFILVLFYFTFDGSFTYPFPPQDYLFFFGWLVITIIYLIITIKSGYYILEKKELLQKRMTTTYAYKYDEIIYIDEEWSRKNKIVLLVTSKGHTIYLMQDKKQQLLEELLKRCHNLKSRETILIQFPNIKI